MLTKLYVHGEEIKIKIKAKSDNKIIQIWLLTLTEL